MGQPQLTLLAAPQNQQPPPPPQLEQHNPPFQITPISLAIQRLLLTPPQVQATFHLEISQLMNLAATPLLILLLTDLTTSRKIDTFETANQLDFPTSASSMEKKLCRTHFRGKLESERSTIFTAAEQSSLQIGLQQLLIAES